MDKPDQDDFEFWSPAEDREERCLFGRRVSPKHIYSVCNCSIGIADIVSSQNSRCRMLRR